VDFDGDGTLDLISGSYDPGELYLFRGRDKGTLAARETIKDKAGRPIVKVPDQKEPVASFGSWMTLVDWDDDGDLDILAGTFDGMIFLRRNEGTRTKPAYAARNEWVKVGAKPLRVPGGEHTNPVIADWDGDGLWDIVTGAADGGVYWYRNGGRRGHPEFEAPVTLVAKHEGLGYGEVLDPDKDPKPGIRSQIAVSDYDGDGKLDILLGDFCTNLHAKKDLTPEQKRAFAELARKQDEAAKFLRGQMDALRARFKKQMDAKGVPQSDWNSPENSAVWQAAYKTVRESLAYKDRMEEYDRLQKQVLEFVEKGAAGTRPANDPAIPHGYVWLFRRR
jgi:hypothetical protein